MESVTLPLIGKGGHFEDGRCLVEHIRGLPSNEHKSGKFTLVEDDALVDYVTRNPACENLEEVGIMMAVSVAKNEATCKADVQAPRQYHALWIRVEAVARNRFNKLMGEERAALKARLNYSPEIDHDTMWRAKRQHFPEGYLQSFLAFKALNNLLGLQPRHDRRGPSCLKSRNSCPRGVRPRNPRARRPDYSLETSAAVLDPFGVSPQMQFNASNLGSLPQDLMQPALLRRFGLDPTMAMNNYPGGNLTLPAPHQAGNIMIGSGTAATQGLFNRENASFPQQMQMDVEVDKRLEGSRSRSSRAPARFPHLQDDRTRLLTCPTILSQHAPPALPYHSANLQQQPTIPLHSHHGGPSRNSTSTSPPCNSEIVSRHEELLRQWTASQYSCDKTPSTAQRTMTRQYATPAADGTQAAGASKLVSHASEGVQFSTGKASKRSVRSAKLGSDASVEDSLSVCSCETSSDGWGNLAWGVQAPRSVPAKARFQRNQKRGRTAPETCPTVLKTGSLEPDASEGRRLAQDHQLVHLMQRNGHSSLGASPSQQPMAVGGPEFNRLIELAAAADQIEAEYGHLGAPGGNGRQTMDCRGVSTRTGRREAKQAQPAVDAVLLKAVTQHQMQGTSGSGAQANYRGNFQGKHGDQNMLYPLDVLSGHCVGGNGENSSHQQPLTQSNARR